MKNPMPRAYKKVIFRNEIGIPTILGYKESRHSEHILAEMCYLYRRTRRTGVDLGGVGGVRGESKGGEGLKRGGGGVGVLGVGTKERDDPEGGEGKESDFGADRSCRW